LHYDKDNEGATHEAGGSDHHMNMDMGSMANGSMPMDGAGAKVPPGQKYTYT
jgi:hypothetical protein